MLRNNSNLVIGAMNAAFGDLSAGVQSNSNSTAVRLAERANAKAEYDKDYYGAIQLYNDAISHCSQDCRIYLNRCLCYVKLGLFQLALDDAQHAIKLNPSLAKCYFRKGQALFGLKEYRDAELAFKEVLILENDCPETNQELVKVRYDALLSLGFDEHSSSIAAHKYDSIKDATEALLSSSLHRNVDFSLNLGSAAASRNVRDIWTLERNLSLNQTSESRSNQIANYGALSSSTYSRTSNIGQLTGSSLINSNSNLRHELAYIPGLEQASEISPITSVQMAPSFSLNGHISSNGINSTVNFTQTNNSSNHRSAPLRGNEFGFGFNENDAIDCGNNILNTLNSSKCSISNNQQNNHQLNVSQSISENVFGPSTSRSISANNSESGDKILVNPTSNGYLYNPFNQLPDSKLIDAIVPNLTSSGQITGQIRGIVAAVNANCNSESGENVNTSVSTLTKTSDFNVQDGNSNESSTNLHHTACTAPSITARHPTSYSDIVKRTKKVEGTKVVKPSETHSNLSLNGTDGRAENGDYGAERKNGCESPNNGENKDTKQSSANTNTNLINNVPTNLWGYNGLRVANVSNSCSKSTLLSLFSKHGSVKLIERINNKIVENNLWVYYDNPTSPVEAIIRLQGAVIEGINVNGSQPLQLYFAPTNDQKDLKFQRPKQPPDSKGECYYWRTTNCFSRNNCDLLHIPANKNIDAQIWMKMKEPKDSNQDGVSLNGGH